MKSNALKKIVILFILCLSLPAPPAMAFSGLRVTVEVIKADQNSKTIDPEIGEIAKELAPVLNYSGFSLIKRAVIQLGIGDSDGVVLPLKRTLELELLEFKDQQARLSARILEKGNETFRTVLLLSNKGSILIGGPPYEDGVLLLRIGGIFK
jgi:hypothetical protein